jgi:hypothetical protein
MAAANLFSSRAFFQSSIIFRRAVGETECWLNLARFAYRVYVPVIILAWTFKPDCDYNELETLFGIYFSTNTEYDI